MLKKVLFATYTPLLALLLLLSSLVFVMNSSYGEIRGALNSTIYNNTEQAISAQLEEMNVSFEDIKAACSLDEEAIPQEYEFLRDVCNDIRSGKITDLAGAKAAALSKSIDSVLAQVDEVKSKAEGPSMVVLVLGVGGYLLYLLLVFFSRKEGIVFYGAVVIITLLLLLWLVDFIEELVFNALGNELLNNIDPQFKSPVVNMLKDLRDNIIPLVKGEAYNITALLLIAPIAAWATHRLVFGVK